MILIYFKVVAETLVQLNTCSGSTPTWASQSVLYHCILYALVGHCTLHIHTAAPLPTRSAHLTLLSPCGLLCCAVLQVFSMGDIRPSGVADPEARAALVWILGHFGQHIDSECFLKQ